MLNFKLRLAFLSRRHHDAGIFETARNNSSARGRKGAPSPQEAYPYVFSEQREISKTSEILN